MTVNSRIDTVQSSPKKKKMSKYIKIAIVLFMFVSCGVYEYSVYSRCEGPFLDRDKVVEVINRFKTKHGKWPDTLDHVNAEQTGLSISLYGYQRDDRMFVLSYLTPGMACGGGGFYRSDKNEWIWFSKPTTRDPNYKELDDLMTALRGK
jgi:hypothetical protein